MNCSSLIEAPEKLTVTKRVPTSCARWVSSHSSTVAQYPAVDHADAAVGFGDADHAAGRHDAAVGGTGAQQNLEIEAALRVVQRHDRLHGDGEEFRRTFRRQARHQHALFVVLLEGWGVGTVGHHVAGSRQALGFAAGSVGGGRSGRRPRCPA
jgi:hypothetical protein